MKKFLTAGSLADFNKRDIDDNPQLGRWMPYDIASIAPSTMITF
jgi:hypothetical protein